MSLVAISSVLCRCFKAMSLVEVVPQEGLYRFIDQGPVARSLVSANRWLRGIKMYRFPWYLTLVSTNHASSNPGQILKPNLIYSVKIVVYYSY